VVMGPGVRRDDVEGAVVSEPPLLRGSARTK
jgi:hypothetical protein